MKLHRLAFLFPLVIALGCGSSGSNNGDGSADRPDSADVSTDKPDVPADHPADVADGSSLDLAADVAHDATDASDAAGDAADAADASADVGADSAAADGGADGASDAADGAAADVAPGTLPLRLAETVLVSDHAGADGGVDGGGSDAGVTVDPNLVNAWGLAFNPTGPLWVADNHSGLSTVYNAQGQVQSLVVTIPTAAGGTPPSAPTGLVFNPTANFMGDHFIFSSEDGTIVGWQTGTTATLRADNSAAHAVYKGLALATQNATSRLFATDFHNGKIDVFDQTYAPITASGGFTDPNLPTGFAPFGIQSLGTTLYVTYAKQDDAAMDDSPGPGMGYVDVFTFDGTLQMRLISGGALNSPWAIAMAPANFGGWSNALLVGNFGDGHINAYNGVTGGLLGAALDPGGVPLAIDGLWALVFGNGTAGAATNQLFFSAGPMMEMHGQLGRLDVAP